MRTYVLVCCDVGAEDSIISLLKRIGTKKCTRHTWPVRYNDRIRI